MQLKSQQLQQNAQTSAAELQLKQTQAENQMQLAAEKLLVEDERAASRDQIDVALKTSENLIKENVEVGRLMQEDEKLRLEQYDTAIRLQDQAQLNLGGPTV